MKAVVDQDLCISCGACVDSCPEVYGWNDDDKAHNIVDVVPEDAEDQAKDAAENCPTDAIKVS